MTSEARDGPHVMLQVPLNLVQCIRTSIRTDPTTNKMKWDSTAEARLLAVIVQDLTSRGVKFEYAAIAEAFGQGVTEGAIINRIFLLRNKSDLDADGGGTNLPKTPSTPAAKRRKQKVMGSGVSKRKPKREQEL